MPSLPNSEFIAQGTLLPTPRIINGTSYSMAVMAKPNAAVAGQQVRSATVEAVSDIPNGKRYKLSRALQFWSFTKVLGPGNSFVEQVAANMGGNFGPTNEAQRLYSSANAGGSYRGGDSGVKATPLRAAANASGVTVPIVRLGTLDDAPGEIAWEGTDPYPVNARYQVGTSEISLAYPNLAINPSGRIYHNRSETGIWSVTAWLAVPGAPTFINRRIFLGEPDYYPPDATFTGAEYWLSESSGQVILSTGGESVGSELTMSYWHRGLDAVALQGGFDPCNLLGTGGAGYDQDDGDDICIVGSSVVHGSFPVVIYKRGTDGFGSGAVELRADSEDPASPVIAVVWSGTSITAVKRRAVQGSDAGDESFSTPPDYSAGDFFVVQFVRNSGTPNQIAVQISANGIAYTTIATLTLPVVLNQSVHLGVASWTGQKCQWEYPLTTTITKNLTRTNAELAEFRVLVQAGLVYKVTRGRASAEPIASFRNLSAGGQAMVQSATPGRHRFNVVGGDWQFYAESVGDTIEVIHEAPEDPPAVPGRAPRLFNIINGATQDSEEFGANRLHYHDVAETFDPTNRLGLVVGSQIFAQEGMIWDDANPPQVFYAIRNNGQFSTWAAVPGGSFLGFWSMGLVLFATSWLASIPAGLGADICFLFLGDRVVQNGAYFADVLNNNNRAYNQLDQAWVNVGQTGGGSELTVLATAQGGSMGPSGAACSDGGQYVWTAFDFGVPANFALFIPSPTLPYRSFPFKDLGIGGGVAYFDGWGESGGPFDIVECESSAYDEGALFVDGGRIDVQRGVGISQNEVGANDLSGTLVPGFVFAVAGIAIQPISITPNDVLRNMASIGAVCVEAKMLVNFEGLQTQDWEISYSGNASKFPGGTTEDRSEYFEFRRNGEVVQVAEYNSDGILVYSETNTVPAYVSGGRISFDLVGTQIGTRNVRLPKRDDTPQEYQNELDVEYESFGGSLSSSVITGGKWELVDATSLVRQMLKFCTSKSTQLMIWPSAGGIDYDESDSSLAAAVRKNLPDISYTVTPLDAGDGFRISGTQSGRRIVWNDLQIGEVFARFRGPDGIETEIHAPVIRGPMMQAPG
jgi:hypothetical protein